VKRKSDRVKLAKGDWKTTVDFRKGQLSLRAKGVPLGDHEEGPVAVPVSARIEHLRFDDEPLMACTGKSLRY
jgi:hypothetical protein